MFWNVAEGFQNFDLCFRLMGFQLGFGAQVWSSCPEAVLIVDLLQREREGEWERQRERERGEDRESSLRFGFSLLTFVHFYPLLLPAFTPTPATTLLPCSAPALPPPSNQHTTAQMLCDTQHALTHSQSAQQCSTSQARQRSCFTHSTVQQYLLFVNLLVWTLWGSLCWW